MSQLFPPRQLSPQAIDEFQSSAIAAHLPVPSPAAVQQFKALFRDRYGQELDDMQALDLATRFLHLFTLVATAPGSSASPEPEANSAIEATHNPDEENHDHHA